MIGIYVLPKLLEFAHPLLWNAAAPLSGHPSKHVAGTMAMLCYLQTVRHRKAHALELAAKLAYFEQPF
jgi:hypothetical protein